MNNSIGIFDSGLGGLTVFSQIASLLPHENLIYLGDTARVPYGVKSRETIIRYSQEICDFLLRHQVKAIVVACNTATAFAIHKLQEWYQVPILGVLQPGVSAAIAATRNQHIGIIGTEGTIRSNSYQAALRERLPQAKIFSQACPLFVPLVEEAWFEHEVTKKVAEIYLSSMHEESGEAAIDTLILGCTHYPLLKKTLAEVMGKKVQLVDSALETAKALRTLLQEKSLLNNPENQKSKNPDTASSEYRIKQNIDTPQNSTLHTGKHLFFATDAPEKMQAMAHFFLGSGIEVNKVERAYL